MWSSCLADEHNRDIVCETMGRTGDIFYGFWGWRKIGVYGFLSAEQLGICTVFC